MTSTTKNEGKTGVFPKCHPLHSWTFPLNSFGILILCKGDTSEAFGKDTWEIVLGLGVIGQDGV